MFCSCSALLHIQSRIAAKNVFCQVTVWFVYNMGMIWGYPATTPTSTRILSLPKQFLPPASTAPTSAKHPAPPPAPTSFHIPTPITTHISNGAPRPA